MEVNKEEALRCLSIAKNHFGSGNHAAAVRFAKKSISLFPTDQAKEFLAKAELASTTSSTGTSSSFDSSTNGNATQRSVPRSDATTPPSSEKKYTAEQVAAVRKILGCGSDYYKVLGLERNCTEVQIKKSYRKLALQFHPDKNSAPGADEAFKLISKAFTVLSDPQKRAVHDAGGGDPEQRGSSAGFHNFSGRSSFGGGFGEEVSPEDLFNMFFGGGFGGPGFSSATFVGPGFRTHTYHPGGAGRRAQQQQQQRARQQGGTSGWTVLLQVLPLLILFGYSLLSGLFTESAPMFSMKPTQVYSQQRSTHDHHVRYYVNPNTFRATEQNAYKLAKLEQQVEIDWVRELQQSCQRERRLRAQRINAASGLFGIGRNQEQYQAALNMPMKSCEEMKRFGYNPDYY